MDAYDPFSASTAPHASPATFDDVVERVGPDSMLVVINRWMGTALRQSVTPEDVWRETLALAWRDRDQHVWEGVKPYRSWLLDIAKNRIDELADARASGRRTAGAEASATSPPPGPKEGALPSLLPGRSATPSRIASHKERASLMERALAELQADVEPVVRRHLFEERPMREIAEALGIPESTAWSRFRKGARAYAERLRQYASSRPSPRAGEADQ